MNELSEFDVKKNMVGGFNDCVQNENEELAGKLQRMRLPMVPLAIEK